MSGKPETVAAQQPGAKSSPIEGEALNIVRPDDKEQWITCVWNGASYSPGASICVPQGNSSYGHLMMCTGNGSWRNMGICQL